MVDQREAPKRDSHGPPSGMPVFHGQEEIMNVEDLGNGWVQVDSENPEEPAELDTEIMYEEDYEDILKTNLSTSLSD